MRVFVRYIRVERALRLTYFQVGIIFYMLSLLHLSSIGGGDGDDNDEDWSSMGNEGDYG